MSPQVSVVMTAYNSALFVGEAIQSILDQTLSDFELIIIDDCSSDDTPEIIRSYGDRRVRVIRNEENLGISRSRNIGLDTARGRYVAAMDHDDISLPSRLARQAEFLDTHSGVVLVATGTLLLENGHIRDYYPVVAAPHLLRWRLMTRCPIIHSSICMRLDTLRAHGIRYRAQYPCAEDFDLYHQLARVGDLACIPDRLTIYREHGANASTSQAALMNERGQAFLLDVYRDLVGADIGDREVRLVWTVLTCRASAGSRGELRELGSILMRVLERFLDRQALTPHQEGEVRAAASRDWWSAVRTTAARHGPDVLSIYWDYPALNDYRPSLTAVAASAARALAKAALSRLPAR
ncbi:MAG: glycosyltransferase family 2 protein [Alphaproteobacteria bacterium]